jgi:hypothetical protein
MFLDRSNLNDYRRSVQDIIIVHLVQCNKGKRMFLQRIFSAIGGRESLMQCNNCALSYEGEHPTSKRAMSRTCSGKKARLKIVDYFCYNLLSI